MASGNNQELEEVLSPGITPALESFTPENLPISGTLAGNDKFKQLYNLVYNTVQVRQVQGGGQHLEIMFCSLTPQQLEPFRGCMPELGTVEANPIGFYHVLHMLSHATVQNTRPFRREVVALMANDPVNALLRTNLAQPGDNAQEEDYLMNLFLRLVNTMQSTIAVLHQKARLGVTSYCWNKQLTKQLNNLETLVQDMQYTLCTRADANNAAHKLVRCRAKALESLAEYVSLENPINPNTPTFLPDFNVIGEFKFGGENGLNTLVENRTLWNHYIFVPDLDPNLIPEIITLRDNLKEIFREIKSFVPNSFDAAADVAKNLRPVIVKTCEEYETFNASTDKTIGKASSLMKDVDGHRSTIQRLQGDGLIINEASVGTSQQNLQNMYANLSDYVRNEEQKARLAEAKAKIELQELSKASANVKLTISPLNGMMSWLSFLQSYEEIIPLYTSELMKAQVVRNSLRNEKDKRYCQDLPHEDMMTYLRMKYDDPNLIPDLIKEVIRLPRASTYSISHNNICQFQQMYMHLQRHKAEYRLDGATIDQLIPVLLPEKFQVDYFRSKRLKEREWKKEFTSDITSDGDDDISISSHNDEGLEELRRKHFITEIAECLPIMRQLMKNVSESSHNDRKSISSLQGKGRDSKTTSQMVHHEEDSDSNSNDDSSDTDSSEPYCPVCFIVHYDKKGNVLQSLSRCPKFKTLDSKTRLRVVKRSNYCKKCLRIKDAQTHQDGKCQWADERNVVCHNHDTPSVSHHPYLCLPQHKNRETQQGQERDAPDTVQF